MTRVTRIEPSAAGRCTVIRSTLPLSDISGRMFARSKAPPVRYTANWEITPNPTSAIRG
jgi:hypothetical protein